MRALALLALTLLSLLLLLNGTPPASAQPPIETLDGTLLQCYPTTLQNEDHWNIEYGYLLRDTQGNRLSLRTSYYAGFAHSRAQVYHYFNDSQLISDRRMVALRVYTGGLGDNTQPVTVRASVWQGQAEVYVTEKSYANLDFPSSWTVVMNFPSVAGDIVEVRWTQPTLNGVPEPGFAVNIEEVCLTYDSLATKTFTPTPTSTPQIATPRPTTTPNPSATATLTRTPTPTPSYTPTNTGTATPSYTPSATHTPPPTNTAGGPTETPTPTATNSPPPPLPTDTPMSSPTPLMSATPQPSNTPLIPTLHSGEFPTPQPPSRSCLDIRDPCPMFPIPEFPALDIQSPTPVALLPTLTLVPSLTLNPLFQQTPPVTATGEGGSVDSVSLATHIAALRSELVAQTTRSLLDGQGTPVALLDTANEIGAQVGTFWALTRSLSQMDLGRVGWLIFFIILLVAWNVLLRVLLFVLPIFIATIQFVVRLMTGGILR